MTTFATTRAWSEVIAVAETTRIISIDNRVGISLGAALPDADYIGHPLAAGESTDIPPGSFRVRALTPALGRINYQPWTI